MKNLQNKLIMIAFIGTIGQLAAKPTEYLVPLTKFTNNTDFLIFRPNTKDYLRPNESLVTKDSPIQFVVEIDSGKYKSQNSSKDQLDYDNLEADITDSKSLKGSYDITYVKNKNKSSGSLISANQLNVMTATKTKDTGRTYTNKSSYPIKLHFKRSSNNTANDYVHLKIGESYTVPFTDLVWMHIFLDIQDSERTTIKPGKSYNINYDTKKNKLSIDPYNDTIKSLSL